MHCLATKQKLTSLLWRQGFLRCTNGSDARVVLKRVKRRVEVRSASFADTKYRLGVISTPVLASCVLPAAQS